jgi:predicted dehydrogenase
MTRRVKIYGAGSIGNHLANASRVLGWAVDLIDTDKAALQRAQSDIYPKRYGKWDDAIRLFQSGSEPKGGYDLICVGTPPDSHLSLARAAVKEQPKAILVEKPLCPPDLSGAQELLDESRASGVPVFVGYDHVVGRAAQKAAELLSSGIIGPLLTLDVEFREHWGGIFAAHHWLSGPEDSYLGFWKRGGGASGEHSHAINFWQFLAHSAGVGPVTSVQATLSYVRQGKVEYDDLCLLNLRTETGFAGRVVQDVVTEPPRKWARMQGQRGFIEWHCGHEPGVDLVRYGGPGKESGEIRFRKTRPDDFIQELSHIDATLGPGTDDQSPLMLTRGLETMMVIAAAHGSAKDGRLVRIDYRNGFRADALA